MPHQCTACDRTFPDGSKEMLSGCPDCGGTTFQYLPEGAVATQPPGEADGTDQPSVTAAGNNAGEGDDSTPPEPPMSNSRVAETVGKAATTLRDAVAAATGENDLGTDPAIGDAPPPSPNNTESATAQTSSNHSSVEDEDGIITADEQPMSDQADGASGISGRAGESTDERRPAANNAGEPLAENHAQSTARSDVVTADELPTESRSPFDGSEGVAGAGAPISADGTGQPAPNGGDERRAGNGGDSMPPSDGRVVDTPSAESPDLAEIRAELNEQFEGIRIVEPGQYELNLMELYEREETIIALQENGRYVIDVPETWHGDETV